MNCPWYAVGQLALKSLKEEHYILKVKVHRNTKSDLSETSYHDGYVINIEFDVCSTKYIAIYVEHKNDGDEPSFGL